LPDLSGPNYAAEDIIFFRMALAIMPGIPGEIHLTIDKGATWSTVNSGLTDLRLIQFINPILDLQQSYKVDKNY
jgi:hypothetical protein